MLLNILGPEIWKPLLKETKKLKYIPLELVTTYTEHTRSKNMEATFKGNPKTIVSPICNDYYQLLEEILKL